MASFTTTTTTISTKSSVTGKHLVGPVSCFEARPSSTTIIAIIVCIQIIILFGGVSTSVGALYIKERNANAVPQICAQQMPCGWEVYRELNKQVRTSNYFVYSPCKCPENSKCVRDNDDVSINSYVHRCRPNGNEDNSLKK